MYLLIRLTKLHILLSQVTYECSTLTVYPHWIYSIDIKKLQKNQETLLMFFISSVI